jgi:ketosteroid isomerase-like protein
MKKLTVCLWLLFSLIAAGAFAAPQKRAKKDAPQAKPTPTPAQVAATPKPTPALGPTPTPTPTPTPKPLDTMVEAERAFSRASVAKGIRDAFIEFFADDGVNFAPGPTNTKEFFKPQPNRSDRVLQWQPMYGDVSQGGDLGYTTGPFVLENKSAPATQRFSYGFYFSVWKRQADGSWKVVADFGTRTPGPATSGLVAFKSATVKGRTVKDINPELERNSLLAADRDLTNAAASTSTGKALLKYLANDARLHRDGLFPFVDAKAIRSVFNAGQTLRYAWTPAKADIANSGDLGYTYGSFEAKGEDANTPPLKGYYLRVWRRDARGWSIVADIGN